MIMKIHRLLLPRQEREIMKVCDDLNTYWKTNDNFAVGSERYLEDLNFKFKLGLTKDEIHEIVNKLIFIFFHDLDISYANTTYLLAQFITFFIFKGLSPRHLMIDSGELLKKVRNIKNYLISPETSLGGFKVIIDNKFVY